MGLKTNKGGLKYKRVTVKSVDLYAMNRPEWCPLHVIVKYLSLLPKGQTCTAFYLQPLKNFFANSWYLNRPAGINKLRNVVGELCKKAGLPGYYTNHSLRSTAATKMYQSDLDEQLIMEITSHHSLAVCSYKHTSQRQKKTGQQVYFLIIILGCLR